MMIMIIMTSNVKIDLKDAKNAYYSTSIVRRKYGNGYIGIVKSFYTLEDNKQHNLNDLYIGDGGDTNYRLCMQNTKINQEKLLNEIQSKSWLTFEAQQHAKEYVFVHFNRTDEVIFF